MIVLLIVIAFIIAILCIPITYSLKVSSRKPYAFDLRVEWMYRILKVHFAYQQGHSFFKEVYLLGSLKVGSARDYEDWLNRRVKEELDPLEGEEEPLLPEEEAPTPNLYPLSGYDGPEPVESVQFDQQGQVIGHTNPIDTETATEEGKDQEKHKDDLPKFWWWKHVSNPALYEALFKVSQRCASHASPRVFQLEGSFGIPKPYEMGLITGAAYAICPKAVEQVDFSYTEFAYTGTLVVKGYMQLGVFAYYGTRFMMTKAVRSLLFDGVKALLQYRRQSATKKKLSEV